MTPLERVLGASTHTGQSAVVHKEGELYTCLGASQVTGHIERQLGETQSLLFSSWEATEKMCGTPGVVAPFILTTPCSHVYYPQYTLKLPALTVHCLWSRDTAQGEENNNLEQLYF